MLTNKNWIFAEVSKIAEYEAPNSASHRDATTFVRNTETSYETNERQQINSRSCSICSSFKCAWIKLPMKRYRVAERIKK